MKLKNLDQELEFIRSAEPKQLVAYVVNNRFSARAEKQLIKRGITEASLFYIKAYGLKEPAQVEVFRANRPQLVDAVLESAADPCRTIALLLTHGEYNTVMKYLKRHDVPQYTERDIVWSGSEKAIISHINRHRISMFAKYDLIMHGNHNIIMLVIAKGRLNEREKLALLTRGTYEEVNFLIETQSNRKEAEKLRQMKMIRFNSRKKVEQFIARRRFVQEAEDFFFKHGAFSLLVKYVMHYQIPNGQEMILKREDRPEILSYLSKHWLCEASEKLLLKRGIHAEIKAYIKKHCFHDEPEVHFVKRGNHREIMLYLANHSLCDEAQRELIYRRNNEEIMYFISRSLPLRRYANAAAIRRLTSGCRICPAAKTAAKTLHSHRLKRYLTARPPKRKTRHGNFSRPPRPGTGCNAFMPGSAANAVPPRTRADTVQIRSLPNSAEPSPALSHLRGTRKIPADENSDDRNEQAAREGSLFF